jgi:hypothetical protein
MTLQEAKEYLSSIGKSTCSCTYGGSNELIQEAIRLKSLES